MEEYKKEFIRFMINSNVLTFGDFIAKSGRKTPFFINTGNYRTGEQIKKLGEFYSYAIKNIIKSDFNVLFGPAYKGIPLVVTTAVALSSIMGQNVSFCFNRKESKDHGEGGNIIGHRPVDNDRIVIIEDVTTAGTSIRETVPQLQKYASIRLVGLIISVDRMEKGRGDKSALEELSNEYSMRTGAIVTIQEIISFLHNREIDGKVIITDSIKEKIDEYYAIYGVR
jgi:orotate phosphoribosyltransferase